MQAADQSVLCSDNSALYLLSLLLTYERGSVMLILKPAKF
jgi:hypothetical protein